MMKGGFCYGLRIKQLSLFFIGIVCTTIAIWTWEKTPLTSLLPPRLDMPMQSFPAKEENAELVPHVEYGTRKAESMNLDPALDPPNTGFPMSRRADNFSSTSWETNHENMTDVIKESDSIQVAEGENVSGVNEHDSVAPTVSENTKLLAGGGNNDTVMTKAEMQVCNLAKGKWVIDDNHPLYSGFGCKQWLSGMWACRLTQRTDFVYEKLKWHPKDCKMKDFTGPEFLRRMQNKTLALIGDSLGRQQFQSLMCMITGGEERTDVIDVGWEYGLVKSRGAVRPDGWAYRFPSTNTTVLYYWSASLSDIEPIDPTSLATDYAMHLDRPPAFLMRYIHKFHVIVLNTGHHWNRGKLKANRWVMHLNGVPNTNPKIADIGGAKNFTIYSIVNWVNSQLHNHTGLKVFYRSISPRHFFNGDWNTGGTCDDTTPGLLEVIQDDSSDPIAAGATKGTGIKLLDITALSQLRVEGHISRYSIKAAPGMQDCLHWCLPGIPDTWNELLLAQI